jgi:large subunit ribosomal protein L6
MSRLGRRKIEIPQGVEVTIKGSQVKVKGPKGELMLEVRPEIEVVQKDNQLETKVKVESKETSAYWGLTWSLIKNMILGVTEGYEKKLELVGVGYRATGTNDGVNLTLGFSHPVDFKTPQGIEIEVVDNKNLTIRGIDKQLVGQTAAKIRSLRKPEPYKGKGIRYEGEIIKLKPGKAGKVV